MFIRYKDKSEFAAAMHCCKGSRGDRKAPRVPYGGERADLKVSLPYKIAKGGSLS